MKIKNEQRFWSLVLFIPLSVAILWVLGGVFSEVIGFSPEWNETFEGFEIGTINGQGKWTVDTFFDDYLVSATNPFEGSQHLKGFSNVRDYHHAWFTADTEITSGIVEYSFKIQMRKWEANTIVTLFAFNSSGGPRWTFQITNSGQASGDFVIREPAGGDLFVGKKLVLDEGWATIKTTFDLDTRYVYLDVNYKGEDWLQWSKSVPILDGVESLNFKIFDQAWDLDNMEYSIPPYVPRVWGGSPASTTEITDLESTFEFGWEDLDEWDSLLVVFKNRATGIFSQAKIYEVETIGTSGTKELEFWEFNFDRNGKFYFYSVASVLEMEIIEDMYLTGGYSYDWTGDLVTPEHWFTINIEDLVAIFEMSDFETWYAENSKFATSTAMFVSISGFFEPIFNYIGEFGNRIKDYFNVNEAYEQGYQIGKTMSYFAFFVAQVSLFLGGFPILKWVFVVILLLTGIFIFRLILKFIPGLG